MIRCPEVVSTSLGVMSDHIDDERMQREVMAELLWDTRLSNTILGVVVERRVVWLTGSVPSLGKLQAVVDAVWRVPRVERVENYITVVRPRCHPDDAEIERRVQRLIEWKSDSPTDAVTATVSDGLVTLRGSTDSAQARDQADEAAALVRGVRGVRNEIRVSGSTRLPDSEVLERIESSLDRQAILGAARLSVRVDAGAVHLDGTVQSWSERTAVLKTTESTPGVLAVDGSGLRVDPLAFSLKIAVPERQARRLAAGPRAVAAAG